MTNQQIERLIDEQAKQLNKDISDAKYAVETSGLRTGLSGRNQRHEAGMYRSNLYLAIRNAVYFE